MAGTRIYASLRTPRSRHRRADRGCSGHHQRRDHIPGAVVQVGHECECHMDRLLHILYLTQRHLLRPQRVRLPGARTAISLACISARLSDTLQPSMDIFVVNSMDSAFQLVFTFASLPIVLIPGFGSVPFAQYVRSHRDHHSPTDSRRTSQTPDFASRASLATPATTAEVR